MELKRQLLLIENQLDGTKKHLHRLQDQKHELTKGLREQECELSHVITGSLGADIQQEEVSMEISRSVVIGIIMMSSAWAQTIIVFNNRSFPNTIILSDAMEKWR